MKRLSAKWERILTGLALGVGFLFMASVLVPQPRGAEAEPGATASPEGPADPHEGLASLGVIEDNKYSVQIFAGENGPLYTVFDQVEGATLGVLLTAEEVRQWFPDLPLPNMDFAAEEAIMTVDPGQGFPDS
jgi:hypothetical protein